jgi:uncharacterized protein YodC (DUF2158 family)
MAFKVGDIVKKVSGGTQKFIVKQVLQDSMYKCTYYPETAPSVKFTFKESELQLA